MLSSWSTTRLILLARGAFGGPFNTPAGITRLRAMVAAPHGMSAIQDGYYYADGLACARLLMWLSTRRPNASPMALRNGFARLFAENSDDALRLAIRMITEPWTTKAPGEAGHFLAEQWRNHPPEMRAIATLAMLAEAS